MIDSYAEEEEEEMPARSRRGAALLLQRPTLHAAFWIAQILFCGRFDLQQMVFCGQVREGQSTRYCSMESGQRTDTFCPVWTERLLV